MIFSWMINLVQCSAIGLLVIVSLLQAQTPEISYIRYFPTEKDFIANVPMQATQRRGYDHLAVYYDERNLPVKAEHYTANGILSKKEAMEYDDENKLIRKGDMNEKGDYIELIVFGEQEPWSQEYQKWRFPENQPMTFTDQRSTFTIPRGELVTKIVFETVDGVKYGQIELDYDYLNYLAEERWRDLPSGRVIRRFKYKVDIMADMTQIWEFGMQGELISNVAINKAPADELYKTPPPRTGNVLDEAEILEREIREKRVLIPHDSMIPRTVLDEMILVSGERLLVDYIAVNINGIQFRLEGEKELLTIPNKRVRSLTSRMGDVIYPKAIGTQIP